MGRRRTTNLHLPARVYSSRGSLFYVDPGTGKWHPLGREWDRPAREKWLELTTGKATEGTVADLLDRFMVWAEGEVRAGRRSHRTLDGNILEAKMLKLVFGRMQWGAVTSKHIAQYLRKRTTKDGRKSPVRANREIALLSSAYSWAMGEEDLSVESNPCYGVRRNTEKPRKRYVETAEVVQFGRRCCPPWLRAYLVLKRLIAKRQGDMLVLGRRNLTDRGIDCTTSKTGERSIVRWTWATRKVVGAILALHGAQPKLWLFPARHGGRMTTAGFKSAWQRAMARWAVASGARFWEHDIRAKAASDVDAEHAQQLLGHATGAMTKRYRRAPQRVDPAR